MWENFNFSERKDSKQGNAPARRSIPLHFLFRFGALGLDSCKDFRRSKRYNQQSTEDQDRCAHIHRRQRINQHKEQRGKRKDILNDPINPHRHWYCRVLHLDRRFLREIRYCVIRAPKGTGIYRIDMAFGDMR